MGFEVSLLYEALAALVASEISYSRMNPLVSHQVWLSRKSFVALITRKTVFHRLRQVTTAVNVQSTLLSKSFSTRLTHVRTLLTVHRFVRIQRFLVYERFAAFVTATMTNE